ncbi:MULTISPECIES: hypothetical protein [Enterococcus]|uniref:hypothetical protein n=1 Tax=Enterococcus TaxID=1350 RepID=UPI001106BB94|nr:MULTISPECIES: hypothetical protein [Enterococcus]MDB1678300.1 hypothetical protein [Enterococcus durans]
MEQKDNRVKNKIIDLMKKPKYWQIQGLNIVYIFQYISFYIISAFSIVYFLDLYNEVLLSYVGEKSAQILVETIIYSILIFQFVLLGSSLLKSSSWTKIMSRLIKVIVFWHFPYFRKSCLMNLDSVFSDRFIMSVGVWLLIYFVCTLSFHILWKKMEKQIQVDMRINREDFHSDERPFEISIADKWASFLEIKRIRLNYLNDDTKHSVLDGYDIDVKVKYSLLRVTYNHKLALYIENAHRRMA